MKKIKSPYHGFRFPAAVISCAVRWCHRFNLSLRNIEELLPERGVSVTYESVRNWRDRIGAQFARRAIAERGVPASTWHLDELMLKLRGEPYVLWRAVDELDTALDILLQKRRDKPAAKHFFMKILRSYPVPRKIVTEQLRSYPAAKLEVPKLTGVKHAFVRASARVNNRAENSHQPTRRRERQIQGFRDPRRTQAFLSRFAPIRQYLALPRHRMNATGHREQLKARLSAWHAWEGARFAYIYQ
ncbi:IS6 family transposase [Paraburkholderia sacchari]|uniref:IS6 family transposase n=1 Tax=Paraburkholderia sacchari TaxID=159450 RepID=UPI003D954607